MIRSKNNLYVILDYETTEKAGIDIYTLAEKLSAWGADIIQLRAKNICDKKLLAMAQKIRKITARHKRLLVINDRIDIACLAAADGVHLGEKDIPPEQGRRLLGKDAIIGITIHSLSELNKMQNYPVNYLAAGPVFHTRTKPGLSALSTTALKRIIDSGKKTLFAIGGINMYNIGSLRRLGINNIAVCRAVILSKNLKKTLTQFKRCLKKKY